MRCFLFILLIVISAAVVARASIYRKRRSTVRDVNSDGRNFTKWFTQPLDHFNDNNSATWQQKYFVNDEFFDAKTRNVAFIMIGGDVEITDDWMTEGQWVENARKFKAILLYLEHRFYGESHPTEDATVENLKYLTTEQALADLAAFIPAMNKEYKLSGDVKWIAFGDSYAGSLAAWAKLKYPRLFQGVVSSSAPLLMVPNFSEYYQVVADDLRNVDQNCYKAVQNAFSQVDALLRNEAGQKTLTSTFQLCDPLEENVDNKNDWANLYTNLVGIFGDIAQFDKDNRMSTRGTLVGNITLETICEVMTNSSEAKEIKRLATFSALMNKAYDQNCIVYKYSDLLADFRDASWAGALGGRQWMFLMCNELGFFQTSDHKPQIFSDTFPIDFSVRQCMDVFGPQFNLSYIKAATKRANRLYGGLKINVTNVVFVHGSVDPWHKLGITKTVNPKAPAIFIKGTAHCADIYPPGKDDLPQLKKARIQITKLIQTWLGR